MPVAVQDEHVQPAEKVKSSAFSGTAGEGACSITADISGLDNPKRQFQARRGVFGMRARPPAGVLVQGLRVYARRVLYIQSYG